METLIQSPALITGLIAIVIVVVAGIVSDLRRRSRSGPATEGPMGQYVRTAASLWGLCAVCVACWLISGRSLDGIGWIAPTGWQAWLGWSLTAATLCYGVYTVLATALDRGTRSKLRADFANAEGFSMIRPRSAGEHAAFQGLSITAGITEEVIFRGFLIATLALVMPVWAAALAAIAVFVVAHAYQGLSGMMRILPITLIMTAVAVIGGSLWPAILIHIAVDAMAGLLVALVDAHAEADARIDAAAEGEAEDRDAAPGTTGEAVTV